MFQAQFQQCKKLIESEFGEACLHSLGNAIPRGINLALRLQLESNGAYGLVTTTSTVQLIGNV